MTDETEITELLLTTTAFRMQCRVDSCLERNGGDEQAAVTSNGVGISYLFAREIVSACERASRDLVAANAENARLKGVIAKCGEALGLMIYETTHLSALNENGSHDCNISKYALEKARAARDAANPT